MSMEERIQTAVESILENEGLMADLDDETAQELLDWGIAWAEQIALRTADQPASAAQKLMDDGLSGLRKLLKQINKWIAKREKSTDIDAENLGKVIKLAESIFGESLPGWDKSSSAVFLQKISTLKSARLISELHHLLKPFEKD